MAYKNQTFFKMDTNKKKVIKKRRIPFKQIKICDEKVIDLTPENDHVRINQKLKLQISGNLVENVLVHIEPLDSKSSVKNNESLVKNGVVMFPNLRFTKSSGRGNKIDLKISFEINPKKTFICKKFIKITRDGPRDRKKKPISDWNSVESSIATSSESDVQEEKKIELHKNAYEKYVNDVTEFSYYLKNYNKTLGFVFTGKQLDFIIQNFSTQIFGLITGD